ncbi:MAG TPA: hypothetical protein VN368_02330 [Candidatus Methylomirabilis sp.]|nr:hypothetical protein [Candidatus Methylomirabilis sp.]
MKKSKGMQLGVLLVALLFESIVFVPAVSAQDQVTKQEMKAGVLPYAVIHAYGPSTASRGEEITLYTSGEIGNIINVYFQKLYILNLDTNKVEDGVEYTSIPDGWEIGPTYVKAGFVTLHDTFSSVWKVKLNKAAKYEVVASVVGVLTIPNSQDRVTITVE